MFNLLQSSEESRKSALLLVVLLALSSTVHAGSGVTSGWSPLSEAVSARDDGLGIYNWNLSEKQRPLLNLPDKISPNIDLSLSYPMAESFFPLFQSLYFNKRSDEYLVVLISRNGRRAELVSLGHQRGSNIYGDAGSGFQLVDHNEIKSVRSGDGVEYTFSRFADGEFRCSHVSDIRNPALTLAYGPDALLQRIADESGRTIWLNYQEGRFSSITQTWSVNSNSVSRTWRVGNDLVRRAHANTTLPAVRHSKSIPVNAVTPNYTKEMVESDWALARIFGDAQAVAAANGFEPQDLANQYPFYRGDIRADDGRRLRGHLSFAMHLYGNADGTGSSSIYIPPGFTQHGEIPSPTDAAVTFYYPRLGKLTNVTLAVFHVANFGIRNEAGRLRIGNIGGPGGSAAPYRHSHIEFYRGNTGLPASEARQALRIDPVSVFDLRDQLASRFR